MANDSMCANCQFFLPGQEANVMGVCRRHPPVVFMLPMQSAPPSGEEQKILRIAGAQPKPPQVTLQFPSAWPMVRPEQWCGEWSLVYNEAMRKEDAAIPKSEV